MELTLEQALEKGVEAHRAGNVQQADRYYTAILKSNPKHPDANHNMGVLAVGIGKVQEALPFFKTALEANPYKTQFWLSYIDALIKLNLIDNAKIVFDEAKNAGANGEDFDQVEKRLERCSSKEPTYHDPPQEKLQLLVKLYKKGKLQEVFENTRTLTKKYTDNVILWNLLGTSATKLGRSNEAIQAFSRVITINPNSAEAYNNLGNALQYQGELKEAVDAYNTALSIKPNYAEAHYNLGVAQQEKGKLNEAIKAFHKALSIKPDYAEAYYNIGNAHKRLDKPKKAVEAYNKALSIKPDYAAAYNNLGNALQYIGDLTAAVEAYKKALSIKPNYANAYNNLGNAQKEQGNLQEALEAYKRAISINPKHAETYINLGITLKDQGKLDDAIKAFHKVLSIKPDNVEAFNNLGSTLQKQGKLRQAVKAYKKALSIKPDYAKAYNNLGITFQEENKMQQAMEAYNKALLINPDYAEAHRNLSTIRTYTNRDPQLKLANVLYQSKKLSDQARCNLSFALAKMYEDIGTFDQAFKYLSEGNALRKKLLNYSIDQDKNLFQKLKDVQPYFLENSLELKNVSQELIPIFILGMPRSGTTLVEQIISSHSEVIGAEELEYIKLFGFKLATDPANITTAAVSELRERYLLNLTKLSKGKQFVSDKMPHNFRFIPLICAAFPEAKIIHVERNAIATCWSNYKQYFISNSLGYCYDLKDVVEYYDLYKDLMKFWQSEYSARIYNLNYEHLVNAQENQTRKLISHLGLNWQNACLSPHQNKRRVRTASQQQVQKKVYKGSSNAWQKYEPFLNGAFDSLSY